MKKLIALGLTLTMALSLTACGGNDNKNQDVEAGNEGQDIGYIAVQIRDELEEDALKVELNETLNEDMSVPENIVYVDTLNEALMTLKSGKATGFMTTEVTARYVAARDSELEAVPHPDTMPPLSLHIVAAPENVELMGKIDSAIAAMKEDGTMDRIYADYVTAVLESGEPASVEIPVFEGAETIKIGISGDLPPIDYVNTDGEPTGFNVAVIAEIAKRLELNIETEIVASGSRFMALDSQRIDAFFWQMDVAERETGYILSEAYAQMSGGIVINQGQERLH